MSNLSDPAPVPGLLLLCLDLQTALLPAIAETDSVQRRCAFAVQAATGLGVDIVFTEQVPGKLGGTSAVLLRCAPGARVFAKSSFSAFGDEAIRAQLTSNAVEHVLLCGIETSVCVYQTALDVLAAGMQVTLLSDCVGARRLHDAQMCLEAMVRAGVHVLPSETVFYSLLRNASHPFFKAYTQLVKAHA